MKVLLPAYNMLFLAYFMLFLAGLSAALNITVTPNNITSLVEGTNQTIKLFFIDCNGPRNITLSVSEGKFYIIFYGVINLKLLTKNFEALLHFIFFSLSKI